MHMHSIFMNIALLAIGASAIPLDASTRANNANDALSKRLEADQGYEGFAGSKRLEADQGYEGFAKRLDADQGYEGAGAKRQVEGE